MQVITKLCFEVTKKKWSAINFALDMVYIANASVEADFEILENAFKALYEVR